jgi:hypothetical protein
MKPKVFTLLIILVTFSGFSQNSIITLQDLAVPASPAFILLDAAPSMIQTPSTPKAFVLGIAQSFQQSNGAFPQEYSAEFAPYWMINPGGKSIYKLAGIRQSAIEGTTQQQKVFSGLQFTTLSAGFFNKDLIPDDIDFQTKIFSLGIRSNLLKIHKGNYADSMQLLLQQWHRLAQSEMDENIELFTEISRHPERTDELQQQFVPTKTALTTRRINDLINQKPIFSWDISAAYASFGIGDSTWVTGRIGVWSSISSYFILNQGKEGKDVNHLSLHASLRYLDDHYTRAEDGSLIQQQFLDAGGKVLFEADQFSFGFETVRRFKGESESAQFRTVGLFSYRIGPTMYMNASFGKNFDLPNKLIALFGINWGFGSEKVNLQ